MYLSHRRRKGRNFVLFTVTVEMKRTRCLNDKLTSLYYPIKIFTIALFPPYSLAFFHFIR